MNVALAKYCRAIEDALRPDPYSTIDQWAAEHRILPPDVPEPGPWRNARTPYLIDIMRTMSPRSAWREGYFKKGVQLGGSASGENLIGGWICTGAGSILMVFPTLDDAKQWELTRFEPMRESTAALRIRIPPAETKGSNNTKLRKRFPGGVLRCVGSNRVGALKSATIRYIKAEELEEFPRSLDGQGSAWGLAKKRASNYGNKAKMYADSTPSLEGASNIHDEYLRGDQRKWFVPCPHCKHAQFFVWSQFKYLNNDPNTVRYECIDCGAQSTEHEWKFDAYARDTAWSEQQAKANGKAYWEATAQGQPAVASWHGPSFMAPLGWRPWERLVADWLDAQQDEEKLKAFRNNEEAECWKAQIGVELAADTIRARAENYALMTVPKGGLIVTAAVDTQDAYLAVEIKAWGRDEESWGVWHSEIPGSPAAQETWDKLTELLEAPIKHASGQTMRVDACAIDSGGHHTEEVYAFCRAAQLRGKHWFAIKGAKSYDALRLSKPKKLEFTWRGKEVPGGVELRFVGTQSIKNLMHGRLTQVLKPGPGYSHYPLDYSKTYYEQLVAEERQWLKDSKGNKQLWWIKPSGARNEAWDLTVYNYAAYLYIMLGRHAETVLRQREKIYAVTAQPDMFDPAAGDGAVANPAPASAQQQDQQQDQQQQERDAGTHLPAYQHSAPASRPPARKVRRGFAQRW